MNNDSYFRLFLSFLGMMGIKQSYEKAIIQFQNRNICTVETLEDVRQVYFSPDSDPMQIKDLIEQTIQVNAEGAKLWEEIDQIWYGLMSTHRPQHLTHKDYTADIQQARNYNKEAV